MGQALYRQYRPKSLADVVGQAHITDTLLHALEQEKLAHAYLFTGPRGVGKTSIARILAHQINQLPYEDDAMHLDIIEIDAASNRRIDEIRDLRDKVHTAPTSAKYKVYIIDEVHMLTREAFNALLKTLEEPPAHAVFILATTEAHKLPETIVSRTQRFSFHPVDLEQVAAHLRTIADKEKIEVTDEALGLIAAYGEGSFRDSISLLDQTRGHNGNIDADFVRSLIGIPTTEAIDALCTALARADAPAIVQVLSQFREQGLTAANIAKHLGQRLRADVIAGKGQGGVFDLLNDLLDVPTKHNPESALELSLLNFALASHLPAPPKATSAAGATAASVVSTTSAPPTPTRPLPPSTPAAATPVAPANKPLVTPFRSSSKSSPDTSASTPPTIPPPIADTASQELGQPLEMNEQLWNDLLNVLKKRYNTLYGITRMAKPVFYDGALELNFTFAFHQRRVSEPKNREILAQAIKQLGGKELAIRCTLVKKAVPVGEIPFDDIPTGDDQPGQPGTGDTPAPDINAISNVFGDAEVLET